MSWSTDEKKFIAFWMVVFGSAIGFWMLIIHALFTKFSGGAS